MRVTAKDAAGNSGSTTHTLWIDSQSPQNITIDTPLAGAWVNKLTLIAGTATDNTDGQGLARVDLRIRRNSDLTYWTGSAWQSTPVAISTKIIGAQWSRTHSSTTPLPTGANLSNGQYTLTAVAYDKALNSKSVTSTISVDQTVPTVAITSPQSNLTYKSLSKVVGTASDTGTGLSKVTLRLYRYANAAVTAGFWAGGNTWTAAYSAAANESPVLGTTNWSFTLPTLAEGRYYCVATATDKTNNVASTTARVFTVDSTRPLIAITRPATNPAFFKSLTSVTGTASDVWGLSKVTVRLYRYATATTAAGYWASNGTWTSTYTEAQNALLAAGTTTWSYLLPSLTEGRYYCVATATDKAGNVTSTPASVFTIDTTLPLVTITRPATNPAFFKSLTSVTGTASDVGGLSKVTVRLYRYATATTAAGYWAGNGTWTSTYTEAQNALLATGTTSWSYSLPSLPEGRYYCVATATDKAGNVTPTSASVFTIDQTLPTVTISQPVTNNVILNTLPFIKGTASDAVGLDKVTVRLYRYATSSVAAGSWAGEENWSTTYNGAINERLATGTTNWSLPLPDLAEGRYFCMATAIDKAGNISVTPNQIFTIDLTGPIVSFSSPVNNSSVRSLGLVKGKSVAAGAGTDQVKLFIQRNDGQFWSGNNWGASAPLSTTYDDSTKVWNYSGSLPSGTDLTDGTYTFTAQATDKVGNLSTAACLVTIDATPPTVEISQPQANAAFASLASITGSATDSGVGLSNVTLRLFRAAGATSAGYWNGTSWDTLYQTAKHELPVTGPEGNTSTWNFALPSLDDGFYTVRVTARDNLGNSANTPDVNFVIDNTKPESVTISSPVNGSVLNSLPAFVGTATDSGSGIGHVDLFLRRSDGLFWTGTEWGTATALPATYEANSGSWVYNGALPSGILLNDGQYILTAQAFDKAFNATSVASQFTIDTTSPVVTVTSPAAEDSYLALETASGTASDEGSLVSRVTVALYREATLTAPAGFWNGQSWDETYDATLHEKLATGTTNWNFTMPSLQPGAYSFAGDGFRCRW